MEKPSPNTDVNNLDQHPPEILTIDKDKNNYEYIDHQFSRAIRRIKNETYDTAINHLK